MSRNEFMVLCGKYLIDPGLALENADILKAIKLKDKQKVEQLLQEAF